MGRVRFAITTDLLAEMLHLPTATHVIDVNLFRLRPAGSSSYEEQVVVLTVEHPGLKYAASMTTDVPFVRPLFRKQEDIIDWGQD